MVNRENYRLVKDHLRYLVEVYQLSPDSVKRYWFYLRHALIWADETPFGKANQIRPAFPAYVSTVQTSRGGSLTAASQKKIVETTRRLFTWAKATFPQVYAKLPANWIDTLRPLRLPQQAGEHVYVTLEEVLKLISVQPEADDFAFRRDQAAAAMLFLSGMRASAFTTLPLSAVCLTDKSIKQWPELGVKTKNGKRATSYLLPIPELLEVVAEWDSLLRVKAPAESLWYPPIASSWGEQTLSVDLLPGKNRHQSLDKRLRRLFLSAGLGYKSAHKFRHGHAVYGLQHAHTMADYKAVSLNLMHEDVKITDQIYAPILTDEVSQRIAGMSGQNDSRPNNELADHLQGLSNRELSHLMLIAAERLGNG